jgi:hypothetical protein
LDLRDNFTLGRRKPGGGDLRVPAAQSDLQLVEISAQDLYLEGGQ